ncbi:MAG: VCBS repeat-containing protein, partial [Rhodothermia bacterium]|nr:VCBS repeat-containing protein [Rhodothermia bacterium]
MKTLLIRLSFAALLSTPVAAVGQTAVVSTSPSTGSHGVATDSEISIEFGAAVDAGSVNASSIIVTGSQSGPIAGSFQVSNSTVTFSSANPFFAGEVVTTVVTKGVTASGTNLALPHSFGFRTATAYVGGPEFQAITLVDDDPGPTSIDVADLDGDGDLDVVAGFSTQSRSLVWSQNNGDGSFTEIVIATDLFGVQAVSAADINLDGNLDIAVLYDRTISWFENDGTQGFTERTVITGPFDAIDLNTADLDSDGDQDLVFVLTEENEGSLVWFENDGLGTFTIQLIAIEVLGLVPATVHASDIDGDGDLDIHGGVLDSSELTWWANDGNGAFDKRTVPIAGAGTRDVTTGDIDGDGDIDLVVSFQGAGGLAWYESNGGSFIHRSVVSDAGLAIRLSVVDVNGDGGLDILAPSLNSGVARWYRNDRAGGFSARTVSNVTGLARLVHGDFDGNQVTDILALSSEGLFLYLQKDGSPLAASDSTFENRVELGWAPFASRIPLIVNIARDGELIGIVAQGDTTYADATGAPGVEYQYCVT